MTVARRIWLPALARVAAALALILACPALALLAAMVSPRLRSTLAQDAALLLADLHADTGWPLALVVTAAIGALVLIHPFPPDDLARDLVAWVDHDDYRQMFWGSPRVPAVDWYLGFDHLAAQAWILPAAWRALPFQLLPLLGLLGVMIAALARIFPAEIPERRLWIAGLLLLTLLMPGMTTRIMQGRPEIWFSVWALSALVLEGWLWCAIGLLLAPLYWLAPIYAAGALLLRTHSDRPWRTRLLWGAAYVAVSAALWWWLSDGRWLNGLSLLVTSGHDRIGSVSETDTVWTLMAASGAALWAWLAWRYRRGFDLQADRDLWLVLVIFLIPDMVRYTSMVSPLLVLLLARASVRIESCGACGQGRVPAAGVRLLLTWACIFLLPLGFDGSAAPAPGFLAHVQPGDRVLAPFSPALYRSLFVAVPRGALVAPAMEVGMTTHAVQQMALDLARGQVDCAALYQHHVRWVVESAHTGAVPPCLRLDSTDGPLRAWRVVSAVPMREQRSGTRVESAKAHVTGDSP